MRKLTWQAEKLGMKHPRGQTPSRIKQLHSEETWEAQDLEVPGTTEGREARG